VTECECKKREIKRENEPKLDKKKARIARIKAIAAEGLRKPPAVFGTLYCLIPFC
jgi:hypothetical protein